MSAANRKVKEGYLTKEGGKRKTWRKRWCVLQPASGTLFYHQKKGGRLMGKISLRFCGEIRPISYKKKKFCFAIETPDRQWHICTDTQKEMDEWIADLKQVRDYVKGVNDDADNRPTSTPGPVQGGATGTARPPTTNGGISAGQPAATRTTPSQPQLARPEVKPGPQTNADGEKKVREEDFIKLKVIGRGSFGKVFKVQKKRYWRNLCNESIE